MPDNICQIDALKPRQINYAFFTNEDGHSDGGYLVGGRNTRNVNLYSSEQPLEKGFDSVPRVLGNIQQCYSELGATETTHKFFMTSYYANAGKSAPRILACDNLEDLNQLKQRSQDNLFFESEDKSDPNRLGLEPEMREALNSDSISVVRTDALIFKKIPGETVAVLGPAADAHPIMLFDDEAGIACYIAGAHAAIKQGVLELSVERMIALGANPERIQVAIGPGLGPNSYEFGPNAPEYFNVQPEDNAVQPILNEENEPTKYLISIKNLVSAKLKNHVPAENIHDIELNTMGFDLYVDGKRRTHVAREELDISYYCFFSARRGIAEQSDGNLKAENPGAHSSIGRNGAGFII
ncbi:MAG: laccase domain-containing protein [Legionellaceae bacterium]|nr:laccase domain-containing protein [Legionellaceae bacterium]